MSDLLSELKRVKENTDDERTKQDLDFILFNYGWHPIDDPPVSEGYYFVSYPVMGQDPRVAISWFRDEAFQFPGVYAWMSLPKPPYKPKEK